MPVLKNPYFAQKVDMNSRFPGLTTALLSFHTQETHLQDVFCSLLVLIHINGVNFLLFLHSCFASTSGRDLSAGATDTKLAKIPMGTNMISEDCICCPSLHRRSL